MQRLLVIFVSLVVVTIFFGKDLLPVLNNQNELKKADNNSLISLPVSFNFPTLKQEALAIEAWSVFSQYREFAREHNLEGIKSLSYQISDTCSDPALREECNTLMDSVYLFTDGWQQNEFGNIAYDERQIVMSTDYLQPSKEVEAVKTVIFFTRTTSGEPRILGIKFCLGEEDPMVEKCVDTDPITRDQDRNGWWDDVEERFYR